MKQNLMWIWKDKYSILFHSELSKDVKLQSCQYSSRLFIELRRTVLKPMNKANTYKSRANDLEWLIILFYDLKCPEEIRLIKKVKCDRPTNRPTDKAGCRVACTRLKRDIILIFPSEVRWNPMKVLGAQEEKKVYEEKKERPKKGKVNYSQWKILRLYLGLLYHL